MAAKRSSTLAPPSTDGAATPRRQPALELRVRIPADLVERLDRLALHANRDRRRQAEWLLWQAIRLHAGCDEPEGLSPEERPPPVRLQDIPLAADGPDPEDTP